MSHDLSNFSTMILPKAHTKDVLVIIELKDRTLLSGSADKTIKRWGTDGQLLNTFVGHRSRIPCLMEVDDNTFISGAGDATLKVWNKTTTKCLRTIRMTSPVLYLLKLKKSFLCGMAYGKIEQRKMGGDFKTIQILDQHTSSVHCMCKLSNGWVVSGSSDWTLRVWDRRTKTIIHTLYGHESIVTQVKELKRRGCVGKQKQIVIATGSWDRTIRIWNVTTAKCLRVLRGTQFFVRGLVELTDGTLLGSEDYYIREYDINKAQSTTLHTTTRKIMCMTALRDGSIVIGCSKGHMEVRQTWTKR
eukprot:TRINITY_DN2649_c2_g2_i1.p1 TRINITY_DN2649_c2_g2~~TRINITY_DN2649_c2_g2_i1.p1  ORF type:complete len:302 (-),score=28.12 TRINITY_DN2649_c2_g2_i1:65-970(-)